MFPIERHFQPSCWQALVTELNYIINTYAWPEVHEQKTLPPSFLKRTNSSCFNVKRLGAIMIKAN